MLATTNPVGAHRDAPTATGETRPMRLLVPHERRTNYWLSMPDTLRASDLGITRATTDEQLLSIPADQVTGVSAQEAASYLIGIRDALRQPRDVAEAREWGFLVPDDENKEEFSDDPRKRLGWWWVYDTSRMETQQQRERRYLSDTRLVDMHGFARVICRSYATVKEAKGEADRVRRILDPADTYLDDVVAFANEHDPTVSVEVARQRLLTKAKEDALTVVPERRDRYSKSDHWHVLDAARFGRDNKFLDDWYEFNRRKSTGRPKGSRTRNRRVAA